MTKDLNLSEKHLKILFIVIPAAIIFLAVIFIFIGRQKAPPVVMRPQSVILTTVEERGITESREYLAVMEADKIVDLRARVSGFLVAKEFNDGDQVQSGQLLFQIEPDQYQAAMDTAEAAVLSAQAQFDLASLDYNRISDLYRKKTSTKSDFDQAKSKYEIALATLMSANAARTQAKLNLAYASIKAPFAGQISDTPYVIGSLLSLESGVLAQVVSVDPILVTFGISDKIITKAQKDNFGTHLNPDGWQVRLRLGPDSYYDKAGKFSYSAPIVDTKTDTVKFKAKFENPDKLLRPGQIVIAVVEKVKPEKRLIVPKEAVLTDTEGNYVYIPLQTPAKPGEPDSKPSLVAAVKRIVLEDNDIMDKEYMVKEGLAAGDKIIVKGLMAGGAALRPNTPIIISEPAEDQKPPKSDGSAQGDTPGTGNSPAKSDNPPKAEEGIGQ